MLQTVTCSIWLAFYPVNVTAFSLIPVNSMEYSVGYNLNLNHHPFAKLHELLLNDEGQVLRKRKKLCVNLRF